jgi:two-component sensor histidine kinase
MMIRLLPFCLLLLVAGVPGLAQENTDDWLRLLRQTIEQSDTYDAEKLARIERIHRQSAPGRKDDLFDRYLHLYEEYASFNCDSAFAYAEKLQQVARQANNRPRVAYAGVKLSFVLLSSGRFKEAFDSLRAVNLSQLSTGHRAEYYTLMARCYYDLADYNLDRVYTPIYNEKAKSYLDSALVLFPDTSYQYTYYRGLQQIRTQNLNEAAVSLKKLLARPGLTHHQVAVTASTLSDVYIRKTYTDSAVSLLARAAIADIRSATKETAAVFHLATLLFRQGDVKNASTFIQKAAADARYYGSRQRKAQFGSILPLIESQKINQVENQRNKILTYAVIVTLFFVLLISLTTIIVRQVRKLKTQQDIINKKNLSLQNLLKDKDGLLKEKDGLLTEKEWLLKEIHHRVKNNLQVVMSLLNSQAASLEDQAASQADQAALLAIQESQHRVQVMALIHQKLYQSEQVDRVDMPAYLLEVVSYLCDSYSLPGSIRFGLDVDEIEMDVTLAVPLGLIINEALINAFKYAFPGGRSGRVTLSLHRLAESTYELSISDDGVGLPAGYDPAQSRSLGMTLLHGFSQQLGGELTITSRQGLHISLVFEEEQFAKVYS